MIFNVLFHNQLVLLGVAAAFVIGGIVKDNQYLKVVYQILSNKLGGQNRFVLALISMLGGILPIEGRCIVSAPLLDGLTSDSCNCENHDKGKLGVLDYVATHHYYLWSPLEPAVVIVMTALGLSYAKFLSYMALPLLAYFLVFVWILTSYVDKSLINIAQSVDETSRSKKSETISAMSTILISMLALIVTGVQVPDAEDAVLQVYHVFPVTAIALMIISGTSIKRALQHIKISVLAFVAVIIVLGNLIKIFYPEIESLVTSHMGNIAVLVLLGFVASLMLGSSSKYSGIAVLILKAIGTKFLPIVLVAEYIGYLLSPAHKCLGISKLYFNTQTLELYKVLSILVTAVTVGGVISYFIFS